MIHRDTKAAILDAARKIILSKGFAAVGLNEILSAAGVPKGSFYHYFKSKEDFGAELLKSYLDDHAVFLENIMTDRNLDPLARLLHFFNGSLKCHAENQCRHICLIAKLGAEVSSISEAMRKTQSEGIKNWLRIYESCIREGQEMGVIKGDIDPYSTATLIYDIWHGASVRTQIDHSTEPLERAIIMIERLLKQ